MDVVNMRARVHMQTILTLEHLWAVRCPENKYDMLRSVKRIWVEGFYSSLYPVIHRIGNASESLVLSCPESKRAIPLIQAGSKNASSSSGPSSLQQIRCAILSLQTL
ncbi:hypothetical protein BS47DRAFT_108760 [Hydnum rufescens UP504]|uniref:Uncharacterized protein n=1 Tax=Hydnum rufescens UP504 TaxID=1448309 RepID=A0A9P6AQ82_9AGAM|nr:hypothetical protein BS47DRAFT_108760 [Hydnum rufescens UP504]